MIYLDTGILIRALLTAHPLHSECVRLVGDGSVSSCHSLAETFNTLTGHFKLRNDIAAGLVESLPEQMAFEPILQSDYLKTVQEAQSRGIQGGIIYDAIHAEVARRLKVERLVTYNIKNFRHVAPDLQISEP